MKAIDRLIFAAWIIPMTSDNEVILTDHAIAIHHGLILDILPANQARDLYQATHQDYLADHVLIPGLINAHTHSPMTLFRGLADDLPLMTWLNEHIWPAEAKWVNELFIKEGTQLAIAEMIRGGVTCFNDMYFYPDITAREATKAGMRAVVGLIMIDFPSQWADNTEDYINKGLHVFKENINNPLINCAFAPHAPYTVSDEPLLKIKTLADELEIPIHIHLHETQDEINHSLENYQKRPLQRFADLGLLNPNLTAVHMVHLENNEIEQIAKAGVHIVHCPQSNLKLASGFCPVDKLQKAGVNIALGTDGASSNNDLDCFAEMQTAAMLAKAVANDASALPAYQALQMATINGAKALGIADKTGSLEKGKSADICAVKLNTLESVPLFNPISQLVYACSRHQVTDVWVRGEVLLKNRQLTTLDEADLIAKAQAWAMKIRT